MPKKRTITAIVPQTREAAEADMRALGEARIRVEEISISLAEASQKLIQKHADEAKPFEDKGEKLQAGLELFAAAHRNELTGGKGQKGKMLSGEFDWRLLPAKVTLTGVDKILDKIASLIAAKPKGKAGIERKKKLETFIRTKKTINKEAMLAEPTLAKSIDGVKIGSDGERLEIVIYENSLND